jgi:hypothetical protein
MWPESAPIFTPTSKALLTSQTPVTKLGVLLALVSHLLMYSMTSSLCPLAGMKALGYLMTAKLPKSVSGFGLPRLTLYNAILPLPLLPKQELPLSGIMPPTVAPSVGLHITLPSSAPDACIVAKAGHCHQSCWYPHTRCYLSTECTVPEIHQYGKTQQLCPYAHKHVMDADADLFEDGGAYDDTNWEPEDQDD